MVMPAVINGRTQWAAVVGAFTLLCLVVFGSNAWANDEAEVQSLLAAREAPPGVVFEIASGDMRSLEWAVPRIQRHVQSLRERFPDLQIAVVSHGREQFALTEQNRTAEPAVHAGVERLVRDLDVPVHVCETNAERHGVSAEQFPAYVQVAAAGPAQIEAYRELGYRLIRLRKP